METGQLGHMLQEELAKQWLAASQESSLVSQRLFEGLGGDMAPFAEYSRKADRTC